MTRFWPQDLYKGTRASWGPGHRCRSNIQGFFEASTRLAINHTSGSVQAALAVGSPAARLVVPPGVAQDAIPCNKSIKKIKVDLKQKANNFIASSWSMVVLFFSSLLCVYILLSNTSIFKCLNATPFPPGHLKKEVIGLWQVWRWQMPLHRWLCVFWWKMLWNHDYDNRHEAWRI